MEQFEYRNLFIPGVEDEAAEEIHVDDIHHVLKERMRAYNKLGAEGWELVAEHQDAATFAVVATFRRAAGAVVDAAPHDAVAAAAAAPAPPVPAAVAEAAGRAPAYPVLQPNAAAPDSFHLVWEG